MGVRYVSVCVCVLGAGVLLSQTFTPALYLEVGEQKTACPALGGCRVCGSLQESRGSVLGDCRAGCGGAFQVCCNGLHLHFQVQPGVVTTDFLRECEENPPSCEEAVQFGGHHTPSLILSCARPPAGAGHAIGTVTLTGLAVVWHMAPHLPHSSHGQAVCCPRGLRGVDRQPQSAVRISGSE